MRLPLTRPLAALAVLGAFVACDAPLRPNTALSVAPRLEAKVCADATDPICSSFSSTVYQYDASQGALPPGVSDWSLIITQFGGQLEFLGAVSHGGAPIADPQNMYVRFFIDNTDGALGVGDLEVVIRNSSSGATMYCGLVDAMPVSNDLPSASPAICEQGGMSYNETGRFVFDLFRTADLSAPLWESQGFPRLQASQQRALFLVQVGNMVTGANGEAMLGEPTSPPTQQDTLSVPSAAGDNDGEGSSDDEGDGNADTTAPTISFSGNAGSYGILEQVNITCSAADAGSGIASVTCPSLNVAAYTLPLGNNTLSATATDVAGNVANASSSFTVTVNRADLCTLARQFASNAGQGSALCAALNGGANAFGNLVRAQTNKSLSADEGATLLRLAAGL